jgi:membrane AbrB-like protein
VISRPVLALCVGLGLATGFGWAFTLLQILLGLILGTMVGGTAVTNVMEMPAQATNVRRIGQLLIGAAAATVLTPDILDAMLVLLPAMIGAAIFANLVGAALVWPFARLTGVDRTTAALSVLPAGMAEMASLAQDLGARTEVVVVVHTLRVVLVVISIPVILHLADTVQPPVQIADGASYAALLACLGAGAVIAFVSSRLGVLNPWILMPMVVGVVLVAFGFSLMPLPQPLLIAAQVGIGFSLGTRLDVADLVHVPKITVGALASGLALIAIMTYVATPFLLTWIDADRLSLVLGLAPGGLGEMIATSKAVGGATALVAGFQFVRSFITNMLVPPIVSRVFKSGS